jgi:hypothetical protein
MPGVVAIRNDASEMILYNPLGAKTDLKVVPYVTSVLDNLGTRFRFSFWRREIANCNVKSALDDVQFVHFDANEISWFKCANGDAFQFDGSFPNNFIPPREARALYHYSTNVKVLYCQDNYDLLAYSYRDNRSRSWIALPHANARWLIITKSCMILILPTLPRCQVIFLSF